MTRSDDGLMKDARELMKSHFASLPMILSTLQNKSDMASFFLHYADSAEFAETAFQHELMRTVALTTDLKPSFLDRCVGESTVFDDKFLLRFAVQRANDKNLASFAEKLREICGFAVYDKMLRSTDETGAIPLSIYAKSCLEINGSCLNAFIPSRLSAKERMRFVASSKTAHYAALSCGLYNTPPEKSFGILQNICGDALESMLVEQDENGYVPLTIFLAVQSSASLITHASISTLMPRGVDMSDDTAAFWTAACVTKRGASVAHLCARQCGDNGQSPVMASAVLQEKCGETWNEFLAAKDGDGATPLMLFANFSIAGMEPSVFTTDAARSFVPAGMDKAAARVFWTETCVLSNGDNIVADCSWSCRDNDLSADGPLGVIREVCGDDIFSALST